MDVGAQPRSDLNNGTIGMKKQNKGKARYLYGIVFATQKEAPPLQKVRNAAEMSPTG